MKTNSMIDTVLGPDGLTMKFQPIFELTEHEPVLHAVECLCRGPKGTNLEDADVLFEYVRRKREEVAVDRACISLALRQAAAIDGVPLFTANVHASTLGSDPGILLFLERTAGACNFPLRRLVLEIVEHKSFLDEKGFRYALEGMREMGVGIALDDVGSGNSNFHMMIDCRPDYFKLDRYIVNSCQKDEFRAAVVRMVAKLAGEFGGNVVAEGIEDEADLDIVRQAGIHLVQGFYFCPPVSANELMHQVHMPATA